MLTIGLPTYDDYDGTYFTIQALRLYHPKVPLIIVDNHPQGAHAPALKNLANAAGNCQYVPLQSPTGSAIAKHEIFKHSTTNYTMCLDCHVLLPPGTIARLLQYLMENPEIDDLLQGPLLYDDMKTISTHFQPGWGTGMYGKWGTDERGRDINAGPFEIPMQGLGLFVARTSTWLGFNENFVGFGGEEFYLHEKYRQAGRKTLCLPFLRWVHRFHRKAIPYPNIWEDRVLNYYLGFRELGLDTTEMEAHFVEHLGTVWEAVQRTAKLRLQNLDQFQPA